MIKKLLRFFYNWYDEMIHTSSLESNVIYRNKNRSIMVEWSTKDEMVSVYVKGVVYNISIEQNQSAEDYEGFFNQSLREDLSSLSIPNLEQLLKDYEDLEYYEKCYEIKRILDIKKGVNDD